MIFHKFYLLKEIFVIFDFNKANIIDGATPPAPKIKTFLLFFLIRNRF